METVVIVIIVVVLIVTLAVLADTLELESGATQGLIPNFKLKFKKDAKLLSYFTSREHNSKHGPYSQPYRALEFLGRTEIEYGIGAKTTATIEIKLEALQDNVNKFRMYTADSNSSVKTVDGFITSDPDFIPFHQLPEWEGSHKDIGFEDLFRVSLPIKKINKAETLTLVYQHQMSVNYQELLSNTEADLISHFICFRLPTATQRSKLCYVIPNGNNSSIYRYELYLVSGRNIAFEKQLDTNSNRLFDFAEYGTGSIEKAAAHTTVNWQVNSYLDAGTICKLTWFTKLK